MRWTILYAWLLVMSSKSQKYSLVSRLLPPENISLRLLANETRISKSTLATWKKKALAEDAALADKGIS